MVQVRAAVKEAEEGFAVGEVAHPAAHPMLAWMATSLRGLLLRFGCRRCVGECF